MVRSPKDNNDEYMASASSNPRQTTKMIMNRHLDLSISSSSTYIGPQCISNTIHLAKLAKIADRRVQWASTSSRSRYNCTENM